MDSRCSAYRAGAEGWMLRAETVSEIGTPLRKRVQKGEHEPPARFFYVRHSLSPRQTVADPTFALAGGQGGARTASTRAATGVGKPSFPSRSTSRAAASQFAPPCLVDGSAGSALGGLREGAEGALGLSWDGIKETLVPYAKILFTQDQLMGPQGWNIRTSGRRLCFAFELLHVR